MLRIPEPLLHTTRPRDLLRILPLLTLAIAAGCASSRPDADRERERRSEDAGAEAALAPSIPARSVIDARPAALVDGFGIAFGDLLPALTEAGGAEVLRETLIDRALEPRIREAGITIDEPALARERRMLLASLHSDVNTATRLLDELRRRRGLGPVRFERLIRRTAMLRALIQDDVHITERTLHDAFDARYGPARRVRLLMTDNLDDAHTALQELEEGAFFPELAARLSTDESAPRGGMLDPVSRRDPSWPQSIRDAAWRLDKPGDVSPPVRIEEGFALLQFVSEQPGAEVTFDEKREEVMHAVRLAQERLLMDALARRLLNTSRITILDRSLEDVWRRGPRD